MPLTMVSVVETRRDPGVRLAQGRQRRSEESTYSARRHMRASSRATAEDLEFIENRTLAKDGGNMVLLMVSNHFTHLFWRPC